MKYSVYILFSEKLNKFYAGHTVNLEDGLLRHNTGRSKFTATGLPWILVKTYKCSDRSSAVRLERKIKKRGIERYLNNN
jgi:putative endonuclease